MEKDSNNILRGFAAKDPEKSRAAARDKSGRSFQPDTRSLAANQALARSAGVKAVRGAAHGHSRHK